MRILFGFNKFRDSEIFKVLESNFNNFRAFDLGFDNTRIENYSQFQLDFFFFWIARY